MANNLARKYTNNIPADPPSQQGKFGNIPQELLLNRQKYQTQRELKNSQKNQPENNLINSNQKNNKKTQNKAENKQNQSKYNIDWGGSGESTNENLIDIKEQEREINKRKDSTKLAKSGGQTIEKTGQKTELEDKKVKMGSGAASKGTGTETSATANTLAEDRAKTVKEQEIDAKIDKKVNQTPGQVMEQTDKRLERSRQTIKDTESQASLINKARNQARKNLKTKESKKSSDISSLAGKKVTSGILTSMWSAVWFDWTFLTLISLHLYLFFSLFTDKVAQFGEDKFGSIFPDKQFAKYIEIIILFLIDALIISIIAMIGYIGYRIYDAGWGPIMRGGVAWLLPGGKGFMDAYIDAALPN